MTLGILIQIIPTMSQSQDKEHNHARNHNSSN